MNRKVKIKLRAHYPENNLEFLKIQYQVLSNQQLNHNFYYMEYSFSGICSSIIPLGNFTRWRH